MKISTKGRYAVRLMLDVAIHGMDKNVSMRDVAERQNISIKYLEQIVSILTRVGYLKSVRGAQGGYRLTKAPSEYTIGDILRTTEGTLSPVSCLEDEENTCPRVSVCPTIKLWKGLYDVINKYVDSITLEDLVNESITINSPANTVCRGDHWSPFFNFQYCATPQSTSLTAPLKGSLFLPLLEERWHEEWWLLRDVVGRRHLLTNHLGDQ